MHHAPTTSILSALHFIFRASKRSSGRGLGPLWDELKIKGALPLAKICMRIWSERNKMRLSLQFAACHCSKDQALRLITIR
jgi:hypothetical protein